MIVSNLNIENKLPPSFYERADVVLITKELIGKILVTNFDGMLTAGRIVEAEAYNGPFDMASHSWNNKRTNRTEVLYAKGGVAYVYLCYGIHQMFNIVTNQEDAPNAILIRAIEPLAGIEMMLQRTGKTVHGFDLTKGPGNVAKALGLHAKHNKLSLQSNELFIADDGKQYTEREVRVSQRIGVDYAGEDAKLPYRFFVANNKYVSGNRSLNGS